MVHPERYSPYRDPPPAHMPDPERGRRMVGLVLYVLGMIAGAILLVLLFFLVPVVMGIGPQMSVAMLVGAILAFPAMCVYLLVPRLLDRYDPEPLYALVMALAWGAVAACGFSAMVNTIVGAILGDVASSVVSAPLMEEASKGMLLLGFFYFLRREFDGVVDGIIYASFVAIGFAAVENVIYYANAGLDPTGPGVAGTFFMRGLLTPWLHPLFTAMTGIGVGLARESVRPWLRVVAPPLGYCAAVFLHALWNGSSVLLGTLGAPGLLVMLASIVLWLCFVLAFLGMVFGLVLRRGRIIRAHLIDEVAFGHLTQAELNLVASMFGGFTAYLRKGSAGTDFVRAVARLALSKWHTGRALRGKTHTVSMDFIVPLRRKIRELRAQGASPC
jgi:RsiW-degrading membrane proteinase PrsW (M82 family)